MFKLEKSSEILSLEHFYECAYKQFFSKITQSERCFSDLELKAVPKVRDFYQSMSKLGGVDRTRFIQIQIG